MSFNLGLVSLGLEIGKNKYVQYTNPQFKITNWLFYCQLVISTFSSLLCLRELSSYHHISKKIVWKYYYATIPIWSPTNSGVKISVSLKGFRICNNIWTPFWGFGSYRHVCIKKSPKFWSFLFESILKLELWHIKSQFSLKLLVFLGHDMKRCALPFFGKQVHI